MTGSGASASILFTPAPNEAFVNSLIRHDASFVVVGGLAVQFYCPEREVDDLDLLVEASLANAASVAAAAAENGWPFNPECLARPGIHLPIKGYLYLDILTTKIGGEDFDRVWKSSVPARLCNPNTLVRIPALTSLIRMKQEAVLASDDVEVRRKHLRDIRLLQEVSTSR